MHLYSSEGSGSITYVYLFSAMALFILLIACINFMNLSTARSAARAKEVGLRKAIGASRSDLIKQFSGESILFTLMALVSAIILVNLFLPSFNSLTGKTLSFTDSFNSSTVLGIILITVFTAILASSYPALFLSAFKPVKVLAGSLLSGIKKSIFRKVLVVVQFSISIFLITGTTVVYNQLNFIKNKDLGLDKENVLLIPGRRELLTKIDTVKNELLQNPGVISLSLSNAPPYRMETNAGGGDVHWEGKQEGQHFSMHVMSVDPDWLTTFGVDMAEGRFFSKEFPTDLNEAFVVNESSVQSMGIESPLGKQMKIWDIEGVIIGVIKDFHFRPLYDPVEPLAMRIIPSWYDNVCIRISPTNMSGTLKFLEDKWKTYTPGYPFSFSFLDERINQNYRGEERIGTVFKYFTTLAIFISCLGLFGLASYMAEQRTKEIGIRKVLGASPSGIVILLSREFVKWVLWANVFAWPAAYFLMSRWLQNFAYKTGINGGIFIFSSLLALSIALITVSGQAFKVAKSNPSDALRYE
jgi:hypothetical protein